MLTKKREKEKDFFEGKRCVRDGSHYIFSGLFFWRQIRLRMPSSLFLGGKEGENPTFFSVESTMEETQSSRVRPKNDLVLLP